MKIFISTDFTGHYPVGTAAVVVARDSTHARSLLDRELQHRDLWNPDGDPYKLSELDTKHERAYILNDGNY